MAKRVDPGDVESLKKFFEDNKYHTTYELAKLVDRSPSTIREWRRRCGFKGQQLFPNAKRTSKARKVTKVPKEVWDNRDWFYNQYHVKENGMLIISKMIDRSTALVRNRLQKYGVPIRSHKDALKSKNDYCNEKWLMEHYADRKQYIKWCKKNKIKVEDGMGKGLTLRECAKLAGVKSAYTVYNWLIKFDIQIRDIHEAMAGERNPFYKKQHSEETKEKIRQARLERLNNADPES